MPQTHRFSGRKIDHNCKSIGQHDSSYYQPQPGTYNQRQQYRHDRIIQQNPSINLYEREKVENVAIFIV